MHPPESPFRPDGREDISLKDAARFLVEECRMVLPGIQALFGFQLVVVFDSGFSQKLSHGEQLTHLVATGLIALAIGLIMAPAAYHRQTTPCTITYAFIRLCTRLMLCAMAPLALGLCIDFYLIVVAVTHQPWAAAIAASLFGYFMVLWFALPRWLRT
jgi:hypothetical protein